MTLHSAKPKLILGSSSPRRRDLLSRLNIEFECIKPGFKEVLEVGELADGYVERNALGKANWIANVIKKNQRHSAYLIIAADTIVTIDEEILQKPKSQEEAKSMLATLSNRTHLVKTGLCLFPLSKDIPINSHKTVVTTTEVSFKNLSSPEIDSYVATGEPMDKAGSYGIQGLASYFVRSINGSYTNVMGLPLTETFEHLDHFYTIAPFYTGCFTK